MTQFIQRSSLMICRFFAPEQFKNWWKDFYVCMRIRHLTNKHLFRSFYLYPSIVPFSFSLFSLRFPSALYLSFSFFFSSSLVFLSYLSLNTPRGSTYLSSLTSESTNLSILPTYLPTHLPTYRHLFTVVQGVRITPRIDEIASLLPGGHHPL